MELLIPDFQGSADALRTIVDVHLSWVRENDPTVFTESSLMLGPGELPEEISETLRDLLDEGCCMLTLGQYLQPSSEHLPELYQTLQGRPH